MFSLKFPCEIYQLIVVSIELHIFRRGSVTALRYRDTNSSVSGYLVLNSTITLYAATVVSCSVGPAFVYVNAGPHRAAIVDDYLGCEGNSAFRVVGVLLTPLKIIGMPVVVLYVNVLPPNHCHNVANCFTGEMTITSLCGGRSSNVKHGHTLQPSYAECNLRFPYNVNLNLPAYANGGHIDMREIMRIEECASKTLRRGSSATLCRSINTIDTAVIRGPLRNADKSQGHYHRSAAFCFVRE
ncbi:hypothetical protein CDAR_407301 [Caerostris darwini]|uniref:Uncharacterized protein n=1 Tax=Caerostris darwini TaxID=1538125 RepID=A0AAV4Q0T2_9ARAC|nr:hypothetical protein CDAR_407301 [Caerostris darwini]